MMKATINVLSAFVFSHLKPGSLRATEIRFTPGLHEVDDVVANHPYIAVQFADGHVESPAQTRERLRKAVEIKDASDASAKVQSERAATAYARILAADPAAKESAEQIERALHTPVGQLRTKGDVGSLNASLNTPVSRLQQQQREGAAAS